MGQRLATDQLTRRVRGGQRGNDTYGFNPSSAADSHPHTSALRSVTTPDPPPTLRRLSPNRKTRLLSSLLVEEQGLEQHSAELWSERCWCSTASDHAQGRRSPTTKRDTTEQEILPVTRLRLRFQLTQSTELDPRPEVVETESKAGPERAL